MKSNRLLIHVLLGISLLFASCEKAPFVTMTGPRSYTFTRDGGTQSFTFSCNRDWSVSSSESWIKVSPSSGTKSDQEVTITITCSPNTTYNPRNATITVRVEELMETISVTQETGLGLLVSPTTFDLTNAAQDIEIEVQKNVQYSITIDEACKSWISQKGTKALSSEKVTFSIAANDSYDNREGKITFKQTDGDLIQTISVRQNSFLQAIDLGLSVKWANVNVGAYSPEEYGDYYAWGETKVKDVYLWDTYKWCNGTSDSITKYNDNVFLGSVDNTMTLELSDDVAHVSYGKGWRIPTEAEWNELIEKCAWTSYSQNGVKGVLFSSTINANSIFLPSAGVFYGAYEKMASKYWSSCLENTLNASAVSVSFGSISRTTELRCFGLSVRPVTE